MPVFFRNTLGTKFKDADVTWFNPAVAIAESTSVEDSQDAVRIHAAEITEATDVVDSQNSQLLTADYKQNIGAYQNDYPAGAFTGNIGAHQNDPPSFSDATIIISGESSFTVEIDIKYSLEIDVSGAGEFTAELIVTNSTNRGHSIETFIISTVPGWDSAANQGSAEPWSHSVPQIIADLNSGGGEQGVRQPPDGKVKDGAGIILGHEIPWFGFAHLLPRLVQDMGNLVSEQVIDCELYNADRHNQITVSSITNNLGTGIEVSGVPTLPFNIGSQHGLLFTVTVGRTGDLIIDGTYTLTLSTGEEYTLYFIGSRIVLFPVRPESPLREHLIFDTKIIEAVDGSEQRIANRQYPRGMFEATYKGGQKKIEMLLFDRQSKVVAYPAWHEPSYLDGSHSVSDLTVTVNTTNYANFFVGGYAVVLQDENHYDALKIESMTATTLTFESGLSYNYADKVQVMPLLTAYIEASSASLKYPYNQQYFNLRVHVHPEINDIADDSAWSVYGGKPFMDDPNMIEGGQLAEALRTKVFVIDNLTGHRTSVTAWGHNKRYSKKGWKTNSRQELWELRQLLHFLKGRQVSFYIPTFWKDLVVTETMMIGTFILNMDNIGYTTNAAQRWPKQFIRIIFKDGSILVREIQSSVEISETQEQLTLDVSWGATYQPEDIERIEFLEKVRIDVDDIVIIHYNALGQTECIVPIKEVNN